MQTIKDRIILFMQHKGFGQAKFAEQAGLSKGFVNTTGDSISTRTINKIKTAYPELSIDWLISGKGLMLNENKQLTPPISSTQEDLCFGDKPQTPDRPSVPYEFVQAMIKSNEALSDERKRYDMERRELLSQQAKLIDMLDNRLSALEKSNASTVSSVPTSNTATAGENEK